MSSSGGGYYRMHRGWQGNDVFEGEPFSSRDAWVWLIEEAAWQPVAIRIDRQPVQLERGQLSFAERVLASQWKWTRSRVHRFLRELVTWGMVSIAPFSRTVPEPSTGPSLNRSANRPQNILTICNYSKYQDLRTVSEPSDDEEANSARTKIEPTKKVTKEESKEKEKDVALRADFAAWYAAYPRKAAPGKAEKAYRQARRLASAAELLAGIERYRSGKPDYADWQMPAPWLNGKRWLDEYGDTVRQQPRRVPTAPPPIFEVIDGDQCGSDQSISEPGTLQFPQKTAAG